MSFWDKCLSWGGRAIDAVSNFFDDSSDSSSLSSSSHRNYDPDKVKIAEIDKETQLQLAGKEQERIILMKEAKLEILREEAKFQEVLNATKINGLNQMSEIITSMQERFNDVAEKRLKIIEQGSMDTIREVERFYCELQKSIEQRDIEFTENKLPKLLEQLNKYDEDSPSHKLYFKKIDSLIANQTSYSERALADLSVRQDKIITSSLATKERITVHTDQLTAQIVDKIVDSSELLQRSSNDVLPEYRERGQLAEVPSQQLLESKN
ncbi:hypothetical protein C9I94_18475 [Photobacterium swingsii]|uniref:Uncharacterized protein n=2 Tax=Photobacterium swingsii TaxID=680026 RepID=A0A2T3P2M4_9GAMM|nr:hypothetical protein [Photobacterium swingsii]PSW22769.1 hypothetical protein C9I94_18475 [Photobacterium swingsii]